jgi:hypothetical protein
MVAMNLSLTKLTALFIGGSAVVIFSLLLFIRIDAGKLFLKPTAEIRSAAGDVAYGETWLEIRQKGIKIGFVHRKKEKIPEGRRFSEDIFMRINTMGIVQPVTVKTSAQLTPEGVMIGFRFSVASNLFTFRAEGKSDRGNMIVRIGDETETRRFSLPKPVHYGADIIESIGKSGMMPGEERTFALFDPASLSSRNIAIKFLGEESLSVMGKNATARKLAVDFMGMKQTAWVATDGTVLREEGMMGMTLQSVSRQEAQAGIEGSQVGADLTAAAAISVSTPIHNPADVRKLVVRLGNLPSGVFFLDGGRQSFKDGILTIIHETRLRNTGMRDENIQNMETWLQPSPFIQSSSQKIREQAARIVAKTDNPRVKAEKLVRWVYANIAKKPVLSMPDALQTLENREGDCNEHAVLLAALARASGIPAEIEAGLVYMRGSFFFHAWNVFYLNEAGGLMTADAALGQFPADVAHLRFVRGSLDNQAELASLIGVLKLDIIRMER